MLEKETELNAAALRLVFLSDYLPFTTAEMKLNTRTFQWHAKMPKVGRRNLIRQEGWYVEVIEWGSVNENNNNSGSKYTVLQNGTQKCQR